MQANINYIKNLTRDKNDNMKLVTIGEVYFFSSDWWI